MKKITILTILTILAILGSLTVGCHSVKQIGTVNGVGITKIVTRDIFAPNTTTVIGHDSNFPGTLLPINEAAGPGFIPATATAAGITAGAVLLRPAKTSNASTTTTTTRVFGSNGGSTTVTPPPAGGPFIPPGHQSNPSQNH